MSLARAQIRHVAELAELSLSEDEEERLTIEIGRILGHIAELDAIDTEGIPPTTPFLSAGGPAGPRADQVKDGLSHDEALAGAPRAAHGGFEVPTFVE
jgi:aspartyl-tRNA(Asn)/glutamyl-tRNA(Gln) amidotransferase subunit C